MLGLDVTYELLPREATVLDATRRVPGRAGPGRLSRGQHHRAVQGSAWQAAPDVADEVVGTGVANTLLLGPMGPRRPSTPTSRDSSGPTADASRDAAPGHRCAARRRGRRDCHGRRHSSISAQTSIRVFDIRRRPIDTHSPHVASAQPRRRGGRRGVGRRRRRRRRRGRQRNTGRDVPPSRRARRPRCDPRSALAFRRHLLADRNRADGASRRASWRGISGFDLFLGQAIDAFEIFTGHRLTPDLLTALEARMQVVERERTF